MGASSFSRRPIARGAGGTLLADVEKVSAALDAAAVGFSYMAEDSVNSNADIAVIGMAVRVPRALSLGRYWENLAGGVECISNFSDQELLDAGVTVGLGSDGYINDFYEVMRGAFMSGLKTDPRATYGDLLACGAWDRGAELSKISVPTLVAHGDAERDEVVAAADRLCELLPNAQRSIIPNAGQMLLHEQPDAVSSEITAFLRDAFGGEST